MPKYPWKHKGIVLTAPKKGDLDVVCELIEKKLAPANVDIIILQTRYRYEFKRHPECIGIDPLSETDVKKLLAVCRNCDIKLIPKMNLFAHQSGRLNGPEDSILHGYPDSTGKYPYMLDGLLKAYPEFNETPDIDDCKYTYSLCLSNEKCAKIVCELMDEILEVFEADALHIGCDEAFDIGLCPKCRDKDKVKLFADWITLLHDHLASRNATTYMWGDRFINAVTSGYNNEYESSTTGIEAAIDIVPKDIIITDWHYGKNDRYGSVELFAEAGFKMFFSPWRIAENALAFYDYAKKHDQGHILGLLATTWCSSGELARAILYGEEPKWDKTPAIVEALNEIIFKNP
jgi:hypothetical protein